MKRKGKMNINKVFSQNIPQRQLSFDNINTVVCLKY